ncbi:peptidase U32 family protein [Muricomes intestini]|uniref:Putative protease n=1 Tax=Muricomes intestini TaxID=1796634 RepID=A0A4R3K8B4_9FIRM|nr:U32 family peptidase [Muricomes intestini]TCS79098.1 putative protease [Muricomes intestini]HAX52615.1 peptidase U32 [Lachnospiraceae bacterium]HCR82385.1 peptidase U32 [Lachnospiraceae bacterium]
MAENTLKRKIEILAPAGSYPSFRAAVLAGADAVYAGGTRFGARAFADNFAEEELLAAIDYAHLHGRKLYLTVNTLLKDGETDMLYDYLGPFYLRGLDAVIVQDIGVMKFVREHFPDMDVHASTQMTVTNTEGALFLQEQGVKRVVPARELSLDEVCHMAEHTNLEIECFVHGALCYSYSGQCLMSSMIGGRSGNRGQCAQPCRLPYVVNGKKEYILSLKDICTLDLIPDLIEAGIDSFKIEGRMKKPEYAALVTSMYRKYTDLYLENGREGFKVSYSDREMLMDIYNRGGFSQGYYRQHNGRDMLSLKRPGHSGVPAMRVSSQKGREITGKTLTDIYKGDVLDLSCEENNASVKGNYTFGKAISKGDTVQILVPRGEQYRKETILHRIRRPELLEQVNRTYETGTVQEPIWGSFWTAPGEPAVLTAGLGNLSVTVRTKEKTEEAKKHPLDQVQVRKQLMKTGNTEFIFETLDIAIEENVFLPMQRLNELRRQVLEQLTAKICGIYHRRKIGQPDISKQNACETQVTEHKVSDGLGMYLSVLAETKGQVQAALACPEVKRIYLESCLYSIPYGNSECKEICREASEKGIEVFFAMPHIYRQETISLFSAGYSALMEMEFDGFLIRNYESFHFLMRQGFDKKIILDHNLYVFNHWAKQFWNSQGVYSFTAPVELNRGELGILGIFRAELIVYGRLPVMVSAQCVENAAGECSKKPGILMLKDRYQKEFPVRNYCGFCYNVIYNTAPLFLLEQKEDILNLAPAGLRIQFTVEDERSAEDILKMYGDIYCSGLPADVPVVEVTRGHFKRGVN